MSDKLQNSKRKKSIAEPEQTILLGKRLKSLTPSSKKQVLSPDPKLKIENGNLDSYVFSFSDVV